MTEPASSPSENVTVTTSETPSSFNRPSMDFSDMEISLGTQKAPQVEAEEKKEDGSAVEGEENKAESKDEEKEGEKKLPPPPKPHGVPKVNQPKVITAFLEDGQKVEIPANYKVEHKVNGQPVTYTVQELLDKASGVDNLDRLYSEFKKKEAGVKTYVDNFVGTIKKGIQSNDNATVMSAVYQLVADSGEDPVVFHKGFISSVFRHLGDQGFLSKEQLEQIEQSRKPLEAQQESEYYRNQVEQFKAQKQKEAQEVQLSQQKRAIEQKYGIPAGGYDEVYQFIEEQKKAGNIQVDEIRPEHVGEVYETTKLHAMVAKTIEKVSPEHVSDDGLIEAIFQAAKAIKPDQEELEEVVREYLGVDKPTQSNSTESAARNVNDKLRDLSSGQRQAAKAEEKTKERPHRSRPIEAWDDI